MTRKRAKYSQMPKPRVYPVTVKLLEIPYRNLERLCESGLFGVDVEETAAQIICRWLLDNKNHPLMREDD